MSLGTIGVVLKCKVKRVLFFAFFIFRLLRCSSVYAYIHILWVVYPVRLSRPPDTVLVSPRLRYPIMTPGRTSPPCLATGPIDCFGAPYVVTTVPRVCTHDTLAAQRGSHSSAGPHSRMNPRLNSDAHAVSPAQLYRALSYCVYGIDATARAGACCAHVLSYVRTALASLIASRVGF